MSLIWNNPQVLISTSTALGTNDISASVTKCTLKRKWDMHDNTHMGQTAKSRIAGLEEWNIDLDLLQAFSTSQGAQESGLAIDRLLATLGDIVTTGKSFMVNIRMIKGTIRSSDNPEYQGLCVLESYSPFEGEVGALLKTMIPLLSADNLSRFVSSS